MPARWWPGNQEILVRAGDFLGRPDEVGELVIAVRNGLPVYLQDIAEIRYGPAAPERYVWHGTGPALETQVRGEFPAVTLAVGKKPGTNAVRIAEQVIERLEQLRGTFIPEGVEVTITRNYGETANDKAQTLIAKLSFATALVVLLVLVALGWREAVIVGLAVIITLAITLFASWAWGFTLNRVSLFALIFSIGILVDDAIVVVENIHRHMQMGGRSLAEAIPAGGRRGRRPDHPGDVHGHRRTAADGLRERTDGAVHESDPDQRQHRHADLAGGGLRGHALADPEDHRIACGTRRWRGGRCSAAPVRVLPAHRVGPFLGGAGRRTRRGASWPGGCCC
jgi:hypothetical protein